MAEKVKRKNKKYRRTVAGFHSMISVLLMVLAAFVIIWLGRRAYVFGYRIFNETAMEEEPGKDIEVVIPEDASALEVGRILKKAGLIEDAWVFVVQEKLSAYHDDIKAGNYTLNTSQTPTQLLAAISPQEEDDES